MNTFPLKKHTLTVLLSDIGHLNKKWANLLSFNELIEISNFLVLFKPCQEKICLPYSFYHNDPKFLDK